MASESIRNPFRLAVVGLEAGFETNRSTSLCAQWSKTFIDGADTARSINKVQPSNQTLALVAICGIRGIGNGP